MLSELLCSNGGDAIAHATTSTALEVAELKLKMHDAAISFAVNSLWHSFFAIDLLWEPKLTLDILNIIGLTILIEGVVTRLREKGIK